MNPYTDMSYIKRFPSRRKAKGNRVPFKGTTVIKYLCYTLIALGTDLFLVYLLFFG